MRLSRQTVSSFLDSGSRFTILYECGSGLIRETPAIHVLDSSFNPPHAGHYSLISRSALQKDSHVMLLLAISNADKGVCNVKDLSHRVEMMSLMADHIAQHQPSFRVLVAITKHAIFVDKAREITKFLNGEPSFLLGFDTFIRILDPRYYEPRTLAEALSPLFRAASLFVLTRDSPDSSASQQKQVLERIDSGVFPEVPSSWAQKITLKEASGPTTCLSSSRIRKEVAERSDAWHQHVLPEIQSYIEQQHLYLE